MDNICFVRDQYNKKEVYITLNIEEIQKRKKIRREILEKLYELFYYGGQEWPNANKVVGIIALKRELYVDNEHHKAYHYLLAKGYIQISTSTPNAKKSEDERLSVMITADGIDYIESIILSEHERVQ